MLFSFSLGSRTCRMIQTPLPSYSTYSTVQTICLKFKFYKGEKGRASKYILQPPNPPPPLSKTHCRSNFFYLKVWLTMGFRQCRPSEFKKKRKNVAKQSNNRRKEKGKKRETVIYNSPRAYRSRLNSSYIRYKLR